MSQEAAYLFAGQGAQKVGMGRDLAEASPAARELFARADEVLQMNLSQVMFEGPLEELTRTSYCQPALYVHGLACRLLLEEAVPDLRMTAAAGLSLGEFTAHAAAGTFSFEDGLRLVAARGRFMDEACALSEGAMAAMIGGEEEEVRRLAADCDVDVANLNAPGQIVLSGGREGIARAVQEAKARGIRLAKPLQVAGAYHSRLMQPAREKLAAALAGASLSRPTVPVLSNVTAEPAYDPAEIRRTLQEQVTGSVRWSESMQRLRAEGHDLFLEFGPGGVLSGLMGRIDKAARILTVEDCASLEKAAAALRG